MVNPSISGSVPALLADTRARASRWGGQLGLLFGWLLVIEFGLMSVVLGLVAVEWPQTPEFLASAAGAWLLLLAGCRGLAAFAQSPGSSAVQRRPLARLTTPRASAAGGAAFGGAAFVGSQAPVKQSVWTRSMNAQAPWSESARARQSQWTRTPAVPTPVLPAAPSSARSTAARKVAVVEVASCVGTGFVLLQADWPTRSAAVPIALAFAGVAVMVCAALDVLVARFSAEAYPRQRLIRAAGWMASGLLMLMLLRTSAPAALATGAVLIGLVETGLGGWLLNRGVQERRVSAAADTLSMDDGELEQSDDSDAAPDFWSWAVQSETA